MRSRTKAQSAMEYLMTYGWAILIIAVVLGALFQLGVFNSTNFAPRAPPGSCRVVRLASTVNLEGVCSGELPQYVAYIASSGGSAPMALSNALEPPKVTISLWFMEPSYGNTCYPMGGSVASGFTQGYEILLPASCDHATGLIIGSGVECWIYSAPTIGKWIHVVGTFDGSNIAVYFNGVSVATGSCGPLSYTGVTPNVFYVPSGDNIYLSNVQIYNTSLSASDVQTLYIDGIGGAPPFLRNLVGWWPLNGDTLDYSGKNNNGVPTGVSYTNSWMNGYTPP